MIESYEKVEKNNNFKRISVLLDGRALDALNKLMVKKHLKISDVVRLSILHYFQQEIGGKKNLENVEKFAQFLSDGSHLIIDIEMLASLLSEAKKMDDFWKVIETEGYRHGIYFKSIGIKDLEEVLKQKESKNWFKLRVEADGCYILSLPASEIQKLMKHFLKGLANAMGIKLEIKEIGTRKLLVRKI